MFYFDEKYGGGDVAVQPLYAFILVRTGFSGLKDGQDYLPQSQNPRNPVLMFFAGHLLGRDAINRVCT